MAPFGRLIRFKDTSGSVFYGEVENDNSLTEASLTGLTVRVYKGGPHPWSDDFVLSDESKTVETVWAKRQPMRSVA